LPCTQLWLQLQASAAGTLPPQDVPPEALFTQAQREEHTRGVDKVTTFPLDGKLEGQTCQVLSVP
jgi:hypothetical protein